MTEQSKIQAGDFFYDIFGYDATLVNFFQVTKVVSDKTIELRSIQKHYLTDDTVVPVKDTFISNTFRIRISKHGYWKYSKWDGKPKYVSAWGTY